MKSISSPARLTTGAKSVPLPLHWNAIAILQSRIGLPPCELSNCTARTAFRTVHLDSVETRPRRSRAGLNVPSWQPSACPKDPKDSFGGSLLAKPSLREGSAWLYHRKSIILYRQFCFPPTNLAQSLAMRSAERKTIHLSRRNALVSLGIVGMHLCREWSPTIFLCV